MLREGYRVTAEFEANHWWFRSRRDLFMRQVLRAANEIGARTRQLRLLDYGCGTGHNLALLGDLGEAVGAEIEGPHLDEFRKATGFPVLDLGADLRREHGRFDILTALDVLEHIEDDVGGLREMGRFLAPGGQLILTVPAYRWLWSGEDVISQHQRRYTRSQLVRTCSAAGFQVSYLSYFNLAILPAMAAVIWAQRLLAPRAAPRSNPRHSPPWLNQILYRLTSLEARRVGAERWRLPAGSSLVCRCRLSGSMR